MLAKAREKCALLPNVTIARDDFRTFNLDRTFDTVVCASNSMNYVEGVADLTGVVRRVAAHLEPGGLFVFDAITEVDRRMLSGHYLHATVGDRRFAMRFAYDPITRRETTTVLLPTGVEVHRRVPIDPPGVKAALAAGLQVFDYFSTAMVPGWWRVWGTCFYVLVKRSPRDR